MALSRVQRIVPFVPRDGCRQGHKREFPFAQVIVRVGPDKADSAFDAEVFAKRARKAKAHFGTVGFKGRLIQMFKRDQRKSVCVRAVDRRHVQTARDAIVDAAAVDRNVLDRHIKAQSFSPAIEITVQPKGRERSAVLRRIFRAEPDAAGFLVGDSQLHVHAAVRIDCVCLGQCYR